MALRDKNQNVAFVYANIYQLYKKAKEASLSSDAKVWRAEDLEGAKITKFQPREFLTPKETKAQVETPLSAPAAENPFDDLKGNLKRLEDLHARLRFMLKELEDLVKKS